MALKCEGEDRGDRPQPDQACKNTAGKQDDFLWPNRQYELCDGELGTGQNKDIEYLRGIVRLGTVSSCSKHREMRHTLL